MEVNPRIWGTFPLTYAAGCRFATAWAETALGIAEPLDELTIPYEVSKRMQFSVSDLMAALSWLKAGHIGPLFSAVGCFFNPRVSGGIFTWDDPKPAFVYLRAILHRRKEQGI